MILSFRTTQEVAARLDSIAQQRGLERSELLRQLAIEATFAPEERAEVPSESELVRILSDKARSGNVSAVKLLLDRRRAEDDPEETDAFDELANRRAKRAS